MAKIGRNDLCHCGSGKKYKKCCEAKEGSSGTYSTMLILTVGGAVLAAIVIAIVILVAAGVRDASF